MIDKNPYRTLHARMSPPGAAWDEGFVAGRAAATPRCDACDEPFDGQCAACRAEDDARHPQDEFDGAGCCPEEDGFLRAKARAAATPDPPPCRYCREEGCDGRCINPSEGAADRDKPEGGLFGPDTGTYARRGNDPLFADREENTDA